MPSGVGQGGVGAGAAAARSRDAGFGRGGLRDIFGGAVRGFSFGGGLAGVPGGIIGAGLGGLIGAMRGGTLSGATGGRVGGRGGDMPGGNRGGERDTLPVAVPPLATALKRYMRPDLAATPAWMRFDPVMTDLQRRAYIATEGVSGNQGLYRSQEAKDYYKNLIGRMFISPLGELQGDIGQLLPIEQQYLQALGIPSFQDIPGLLAGLGYTPSSSRPVSRQHSRMNFPNSLSPFVDRFPNRPTY